ncbi:hypothetical protein AgCh_035326 [Apium graveolens]
MDQPAVGEETFILKTNIHSDVCLKNMEKILQHIQGVRRIFLHPNEIGKVTISGTIDPQKLIEILWMNGIESEHVLGASIDQKDLPNFPRPNSPLKHVVDYEVVSRLEALSKLKGFKTVAVTKNGMKLTYKEDGHVQDLDGKIGSCSTRNLHRNAVHNDCSDLHKTCSSRIGCYSTNCGYMPQPESVSVGIPCPPPPYIPSAPPVPEFYPDSPLQEKTSDRIYLDDNPTGYFVLFLFCFLLLLIQATL